MSNRDLREVLHSGYSFVRGVEANKAAASITLDHLIQSQIDDLKSGETTAIIDAQGKTVGGRPSKFDQLDSLKKDIDAVVQAVKDAGSDSDKLASLGVTDLDLPTEESAP